MWGPALRARCCHERPMRLAMAMTVTSLRARVSIRRSQMSLCSGWQIPPCEVVSYLDAGQCKRSASIAAAGLSRCKACVLKCPKARQRFGVRLPGIV